MATPVPFTVNPNAFAKCAPAITTDIKRCGSVTQCNAQVMTSDDLPATYMEGNEFRVMEALFHYDFEIKMCEAVQNGLYDFLMANKFNMSKKMNSRRINSGLWEIAPFVMARQKSPINNEYWLIFNGQVNGANWQVNVQSTTNIPPDVRSFPAGMRLFADGLSPGGSSTKTAWQVVSSTISADGLSVVLVLASQNMASNLTPDKLGNPVSGILRRGTPNVSDWENFCAEQPAYLNWKNVPFWIETTRTSLCDGELYNRWKKLVLEDNALYREFFDLDEIDKNRQLAADYQRRLVNAMFFNKPLQYQNLGEYDNLQDITTFDGSSLGLGVDGARCVGKRANAIGIYEQLAECGRIYDAQGAQLNFPALFTSLYNMMRVREGNGHPNPKSFDVFTDTVTAKNLNTAFLQYYIAEGQNIVRLNVEAGNFSMAKKAAFGFYYTSYPIFWPQGVTINVITHEFFDDYITAATLAGQGNTARVLWILDFTGIYPGIFSSSRMVHKTGDLQTLAAINSSFACVMKVPTQTQTLMSMIWTMVVECPFANLIIENFSSQIPEPEVAVPGLAYPATTTGTTTTTPTIFKNTAQTYTTTAADCPGGTGTPTPGNVTVTVPANTYASIVSLADANAQALTAATQEAKSKLQCV